MTRFLTPSELDLLEQAAGIGPQWSRMLDESYETGEASRHDLKHAGKSYVLLAAYVSPIPEEAPMLPRQVVLEISPGAGAGEINYKLGGAAMAMQNPLFHEANRMASNLGIEPFCTS